MLQENILLCNHGYAAKLDTQDSQSRIRLTSVLVGLEKCPSRSRCCPNLHLVNFELEFISGGRRSHSVPCGVQDAGVARLVTPSPFRLVRNSVDVIRTGDLRSWYSETGNNWHGYTWIYQSPIEMGFHQRVLQVNCISMSLFKSSSDSWQHVIDHFHLWILEARSCMRVYSHSSKPKQSLCIVATKRWNWL